MMSPRWPPHSTWRWPTSKASPAVPRNPPSHARRPLPHAVRAPPRRAPRPPPNARPAPRTPLRVRVSAYRGVRLDRRDRGRVARRRVLHRAPYEAGIGRHGVVSRHTRRRLHRLRLPALHPAGAHVGRLPRAAFGHHRGGADGGGPSRGRRRLDGGVPAARHAGAVGDRRRLRTARSSALDGGDRENSGRGKVAGPGDRATSRNLYRLSERWRWLPRLAVEAFPTVSFLFQLHEPASPL